MIPKKVTNYNDWDAGVNSAIERVMDNAAYSSAHPDDTFVFVGPPRLPDKTDGATPGETDYQEYASVGMLQSIVINQAKPFQPMMALGSARTFYLGGKSQGSAQIGRLFLNTENFLKRVYQNIVGQGVTRDLYTPNPPGASDHYFINLDSEFFLIPFGMGVIFKNKMGQGIGGFYMELCVIPTYTVGVQAGQSMIMEGVSVLFDRLLPLGVGNKLIASDILTKLEKVVGSQNSAATT